MSKQHLHVFLLLLVLMIISLACEITFSPDMLVNEQSEGELIQTNQVKLQTSVAKTVEAMKPSEEIDPADEPEQPQDEPAPVGPATSTPLPCNKPKFQGETIPDDTEFDPGDTFTKTWTVLNEGTCSWTTSYKLVFTSGDQMGGPSSKNFTKTINPGETATLSVDLTAPTSDGTYSGTWKIEADDGERFGNYWAQIVVGEPEEESSDSFAVTSVSFDGSDQMKVGFCPHSFNFLAKIKTDGKGTVKYHWVISNGYESSVESIKFDSAGTKTVTLNKNLACSGTSTCSYIVELYIDYPNHQKFGAWPIAIHCM